MTCDDIALVHGPLHHHARFYVNVFLSRFPGSRTILAHLSIYVYRVCTFLFFIYSIERDPCHRKVFCAFFLRRRSMYNLVV